VPEQRSWPLSVGEAKFFCDEYLASPPDEPTTKLPLDETSSLSNLAVFPLLVFFSFIPTFSRLGNILTEVIHVAETKGHSDMFEGSSRYSYGQAFWKVFGRATVTQVFMAETLFF